MTYHLKKSPVTFFLLILTVLVFLGMQVTFGPFASSPQAVYQFGGMLGVVVKEMPSQLWRLVTPIFVHIGWNHFLVNSMTLFFVGQLAEKIWGSKQFLLLYVLSGIMGNLFVMLFTPEAVSAGASTSLFGLFAAIMVLGWQSSQASLKGLAKSYQSLILVNLILNLFMPNVSIAGHLGGIVGGILAAYFLNNKVPDGWPHRKERMIALALYTCIILGSVLLTLLN